jgi:NodT family efflux transporter outer membrane factor (OMF) lipoprotein
LANVRLSMQAALVQDYLLLRVVERERQLADETVAAYARTAQIARNQLAVGLVTPTDVALAEAQLKSAEAQRADYELSRRQYEHAIAVLIGKAPADFHLPPAVLTRQLPTLPAALPAMLLERRPDVASAERSAAAANAQIGVARAAWFPALNLSASGGSSATAVAELFKSPARVWSLGAGLAETVFDGGARSARVDEALAAYDASAAQYRQTVLGALQEVEDNLAATVLLQEEADRQGEAVKAAAEAERLALSQYKAGTADFTTVATAQASHHQAEIAALQIQGRRFSASVLLVKALGGGWDGNLTPAVAKNRG